MKVSIAGTGLIAAFLAAAAIVVVDGQHTIRRSEQARSVALIKRNLLTGQEYFRSKDPSVIGGAPNVTAGMGNPLKGLMGGARWARPPLLNTVPLSMEWYNLGLDEMMVGDNKFDWKILDGLLQGSASRKMHAVFSVFIHWPGQPLRLPPHLMDIALFDTKEGKSPNYGDARVLKAIEQFIKALGARYDGDKRIANIHVGLLGFWGEGHTWPTQGLVPDSSTKSVMTWYDESFKTTQIQARYPEDAANKGYYDGSLFYTTLSGAANGGVEKEWHTYPRVVKAGMVDNWKKQMIAGETFPGIAAKLFTPTYPARTENHQDIKEVLDTLHISWFLHHGAFSDGGYTGETLANARKWHAYVGYSFAVSEVAASVSASGGVDVDVTVTQNGIAPFYYDLNLVLECAGLPVPMKQGGVNELIDKGQSKTFTFTGLPASSECLNQVSILLDSSYAYSGKPILFAQGSNGKVSVRLPLPGPTMPVAPVRLATKPPAPAPVPVAAAPTTSEGISALRLVYTGSPSPHSSVMNLVLGNARVNVIDLAALNVPSAAFNIDAVRTSTAVQSVVFSNNRLDNAVPFSYCGNSGENYATCDALAVGATVTVSVTPYPLANQQGTPFSTVSATLQIIDSRIGGGAVPVPMPVPAVVVVPTTAPVLPPMLFIDARSRLTSRVRLTRNTKLSSVNDNVSLGAVTSGYQADLFRHHRWRSGGLTYVMTGFAPGSSQSITLGFAETHAASCGKGKRIFNVLANGGVTLWSNVDVFAASGACRTALVLTKTAKADARGSIELRFVAVKQNPMVSFIDIVQV